MAEYPSNPPLDEGTFSPIPSSAESQRAAGPSGTLERATAVHVGILVICATWALGGNVEWARMLLSCWGSLAVLVTLTAVRQSGMRADRRLQPLLWLWPLALFDVLVVVSLFNPSFRDVTDGVSTFSIETPDLPRWSFLPSTARPDLSFQALWFFNAAYLSCFNLVLTVRRRRTLRLLLLAVAANAIALAIFGTLQKLAGAKALFFGLVPTAQIYFFSSFIYHNHWGAFTVLMMAVVIALVFHTLRSSRARDFWHSPAFAGVVAVLLLAVTLPLSTSRSCTALAVVLLAVAFGQWIVQLMRKRRAFNEPVAMPLVASLVAIVLAAGFIYQLAQPILAMRLANTREQIAQMRARGEYLPRAVLYRDTWHMAREKLWFGWGMASYPTVFYSRNTQRESSDGPERLFHDAHSDWLQSVSETGLVGTCLLGLCALVPLWSLRRIRHPSPIVRYLLLGCGLIVAYAWLEFPFGNRAVIIAFWLCFFCAVQYGRLSVGHASHS